MWSYFKDEGSWIRSKSGFLNYPLGSAVILVDVADADQCFC